MMTNLQNNKNMTAQKNITLDFTGVDTNGQEVAIMPAWLAKQLLQNLALQPSSSRAIIGSHIDDLRECMSTEDAMQKAIELSIQFVQIRQLVSNVQAENWAAYTVPPIEVQKY
jgi:hypothetical protein